MINAGIKTVYMYFCRGKLSYWMNEFKNLSVVDENLYRAIKYSRFNDD